MMAMEPLRLIEGQAEEILAPVIEQIHNDPGLEHLRRASEAELYEWGSRILGELSDWLLDRNNKSFAWRYDELAPRRPAKSAPLHEALRAFHILKKGIIGFVRDQGGNPPAVEMCAEEELGEFFDWMEERLAQRDDESGMPQELQRASAPRSGSAGRLR